MHTHSGRLAQRSHFRSTAVIRARAASISASAAAVWCRRALGARAREGAERERARAQPRAQPVPHLCRCAPSSPLQSPSRWKTSSSICARIRPDDMVCRLAPLRRRVSVDILWYDIDERPWLPGLLSSSRGEPTPRPGLPWLLWPPGLLRVLPSPPPPPPPSKKPNGSSSGSSDGSMLDCDWLSRARRRRRPAPPSAALNVRLSAIDGAPAAQSRRPAASKRPACDRLPHTQRACFVRELPPLLAERGAVQGAKSPLLFRRCLNSLLVCTRPPACCSSQGAAASPCRRPPLATHRSLLALRPVWQATCRCPLPLEDIAASVLRAASALG
eukprot:COSAG06_NODE_4709_length_4022_cov_26.270966_2_plen_329_part_00